MSRPENNTAKITRAAIFIAQNKTSCGERYIKIRELPSGIEYHSRLGDDFIYEFYFNIGEETAVVSDLCGIDMLTGKGIDGSVTILPKGYIVLKK